MYRFILLAVPWVAAAQVDFAREVHPILTAKCTGCHANANAQGGLKLNTRAEMLKGGQSGPSIVPGKGAASLLIQRVTGEKGTRMPLGSPPLSSAEIATLRKWIDEGSKAPELSNASKWTPTLALKKPALPKVDGNPVDAFLKLPQGRVSDALFARRAYLDVWGLPPTPEQLAAFQKAPDRAKLIDQLLASDSRYAAHWISFWNDLLRNDEGVTYYGDRKSITAWLEKALGSNLPYDRLVASLLNPTGENAPEGFLTGVTWRGVVPASELPPMQAAQTSAQTFLGVNLKCNSCHDSFISSWKLKDAYGLASFFSEEPLELVRCDAKTGEMSQPKFLFSEIATAQTGGPLKERRAEAARLFTHPDNGRLPRTLVNRYWKQLMGRGVVEPVDDMSAEPWNPDLLDWLAADFVEHGYDLKHLLRIIMTSRAYQLPSVDQWSGFKGPLKRRLTAEQFADSIAAITGEWRPLPTHSAQPTRYVREWRLKSSPLTRAMGRPVRDQVVTERLTQPTTLQALELVNGQMLAEWLRDGARRLTGKLPPPPQNLFDSGTVRRNTVPVDVDITNVSKLYLLVENVDSYDPNRVIAQWRNARFFSPSTGPVPLKVDGVNFDNMKPGTRVVIDIAGKGYTKLLSEVTTAPESHISEIAPVIRFFVFDRDPDMKRLVKVKEETPEQRPAGPFTADTLVAQLYRHALQRDPSSAERDIAPKIAGSPLSADGVEDLLWMILMSPEFQYIR